MDYLNTFDFRTLFASFALFYAVMWSFAYFGRCCAFIVDAMNKHSAYIPWQQAVYPAFGWALFYGITHIKF